LAAGVTVGAPIVAQAQDLPLNFSDGSKLTLLNGTRASVRELHANGATVDLESGKTKVSVRHQSKTRWNLSAGPYQVGVTGTKFDLEWLPSRERFELLLEEGSVVVSTDKNNHAAVRMNAPERLLIDHGQWQLSPVGKSNAQLAALEPDSSQAPAVPPAPRALDSGPTSISTASPSAPSARSWQDWSKLGKYSQAYAEAAAAGLPRLAQTGSAQSLLTLAEVCRFAGHPGDAVATLSRLRQRFDDTPESAIAAFQLGRLSQGEHAAQWFRTYLRERPNGELAREASGRLLEALDRAGNRAAALEAAKSYLLRYPSGPHASFARQIRGY
jgi:TolA-binding protein